MYWQQLERDRGLSYSHHECTELSAQPISDETASIVDGCLRPSRVSAGRTAAAAAFLIGDSHASNHIVSLQAAIGREYELRFATVGHGCGFMTGGGNPFDGLDSRCAELYQLAMAAVVAYLQAGDVLVTSTTSYGGAIRYAGYAGYEDFLTHTLRPLVHARGAALVLLGDTPLTKAGFDYECRLTCRAEWWLIARAHRAACAEGRAYDSACDEPRDYNRTRQVDEIYERVARGGMAVGTPTFHLRLFDLFCNETDGVADDTTCLLYTSPSPRDS